jgi:hypothetical protein
MVKIKSEYLKKSVKNIKTATMVIGSAFMMSGLMSSCGDNTEYATVEVLNPTQGIVTEVKEMQKDKFKITSETVVDTKEDSRIIAEYMDGARDTFTLEEARVADAANPVRRSSMNGILMGGMMGYMMGKSMSTPVSKSAYANNSAYAKSNTSTSNLKSSATRTSVSKPKSGFGSSKSSRSYGG